MPTTGNNHLLRRMLLSNVCDSLVRVWLVGSGGDGGEQEIDDNELTKQDRHWQKQLISQVDQVITELIEEGHDHLGERTDKKRRRRREEIGTRFKRLALTLSLSNDVICLRFRTTNRRRCHRAHNSND